MKLILLVILVTISLLPAFAQTYPQTLPTEKNTLDVQIMPTPANPEPGDIVKFKINFLNPTTKKIQEHIDYTMMVSKDGVSKFGPIPLTHTSEGSVTIPVQFQEKGVYTITLTIEGILFQPIPKEDVSFEFNVGEPAAQPSPVTSSPKSNDGGCLIATATYGSELAPQVQQLRELRDNSLLKTESGTSFMKSFNEFYYSFSPTISDWERQNPAFKEAVKIAITPMMSTLSILNHVDLDSEAKVVGYGLAIISLNVGMYIGLPIFAILKFHQIRKK